MAMWAPSVTRAAACSSDMSLSAAGFGFASSRFRAATKSYSRAVIAMPVRLAPSAATGRGADRAAASPRRKARRRVAANGVRRRLGAAREREGIREHVIRVGARQMLRAARVAGGDGGADRAVLGHARGEPLGQIERAQPQHEDLRVDVLEELAQDLVAGGGEDQVVKVDGRARVRL